MGSNSFSAREATAGKEGSACGIAGPPQGDAAAADPFGRRTRTSLRILQVFKDYFPPTRGGIEQHVHELVHSVDGFRFSVLTSSRGRRLVVDDDGGVRVVRAPEYARPVSTPITPAWARLLRESEADLFHFHVPNPFGELAYFASRAPVPLVATYHSDIVGRRALLPFFRPFQQRFLARARRIVVNNPRLLASSPTLAPHRSRAVVIPFGLDAGMWSGAPQEAEAIRQRHPGPLVLFLGRLAYYKGLDVLLSALRGVEATLLVVGDGPRRPELEAQAARSGISDRVVFVGEIPDADRPAYYHAADVFVLPSTSRAETFGIAMLEAMACGAPAISTELGTGTSWVNVHEETGLVVPPGDPARLADALGVLLGDEGRRREMGKAAAERVAARFRRQDMLDAIASVYRSL